MLTEVAELLHHYAEVHHALQMPEHGIRTDVAAYLRKLFTARIPSVRPDSSASRSPRAAEIGCDQVEGRAVRAD